MAIIEADAQALTPFERDVAATQRYFDSPRFEGIVRLYTARQVAEQRGTIASDYIVAREAATAFYARLRELFAERKSITTFGPYSPGQAVAMKRMGIEGIYLGGWATSAKGSTTVRTTEGDLVTPFNQGHTLRQGLLVGLSAEF